MSNFIEKLSNNFVGTHQDKKQIILTHTSRDVEEYLTSLKYRMNGKFTRIPHYIIAKDGSVIQTLSEEHYSDFFHYPQINEESIIISLENLGWLEKVPLKDQYTNWIGNIYKGVPYEKKWRDYFLWEPYTEAQMVSTAELCIKIVNKHNIEKKSVGHNTRISGIEDFGGIVSRSNYDNDFTDVSPAFNFETFVKYIKNEQFV
jgi:N-acetyl-anhydromuramyl-L-alanine amidase AmpD